MEQDSNTLTYELIIIGLIKIFAKISAADLSFQQYKI